MNNNHVNLTVTDPNDPDLLHESDASRRARKTRLFSQVDADARDYKRHAKRATRLDTYFSKYPPNGPQLAIFRCTLADFANTNGEPPRWLSYEHLEASFDRLKRSGILIVESTADAFGAKTFKSQVTTAAMAKRRNVRPAELDVLVRQLKENLGDVLQEPRLTLTLPVHGCRYVPIIDKWRVSVYFGGSQRALGCYPFSTAIRLQDVLTLHFSPYRQSAYNTSAEHAAELLAKHPALATFCAGLEEHWLITGVLSKPGVDKAAEWRQAIECQNDVLAKRLTAIEASLEALLRRVNK